MKRRSIQSQQKKKSSADEEVRLDSRRVGYIVFSQSTNRRGLVLCCCCYRSEYTLTGWCLCVLVKYFCIHNVHQFEYILDKFDVACVNSCTYFGWEKNKERNEIDASAKMICVASYILYKEKKMKEKTTTHSALRTQWSIKSSFAINVTNEYSRRHCAPH